MAKLTVNKFKRELQPKVKVLPAGERHKDFDYPIFVDLPGEWKVLPNTPVEVDEIRTAVVFAGDIKRNFIEYYILQRVDWERDRVECLNQGQAYTFYTDAVALIPKEIIPTKIKLEVLLSHDDLIDIDRKKKARKQAERQQKEQKIEALAEELKNGGSSAGRTRSTDPSGSTEQVQELESHELVDRRDEVDGKEKEDGNHDRLGLDGSES